MHRRYSSSKKEIDNMNGHDLKLSLKKALGALRIQTATILAQDGTITNLVETIVNLTVEFATRFLKASCQNCVNFSYASVVKGNVTSTLTAEIPEPHDDTEEETQLTRIEKALKDNRGPVRHSRLG